MEHDKCRAKQINENNKNKYSTVNPTGFYIKNCIEKKNEFVLVLLSASATGCHCEEAD